MLGVGEKFPPFSLKATVGITEDTAFITVRDHDYAAQWKVYFFWPKDFCPVSLVEVLGFAALDAGFTELQTQGLGVSVESEYAHLAWRRHEEKLKDFPFPMLSDINQELCGQLGILDESEGAAQRATFIVDRDGIIRFVYVTDLDVVRDPGEVLRVLAHLRGAAWG
jgi:peroxiredoxin (alkyl hydroperoxide reductase subunit C)